MQLLFLPYIPCCQLASMMLMACLWRQNARVMREGKGFLPQDPLDTASGRYIQAAVLLLIAMDVIASIAAAFGSAVLVMMGVAVTAGQMVCGGYFVVSCCQVSLPFVSSCHLLIYRHSETTHTILIHTCRTPASCRPKPAMMLALLLVV